MPSPPTPKNNYGWTPERRAAARERALKNKPWEQSTGPKSEAGKARISQNARKNPVVDQERLRIAREMLDLNKAFYERWRVIYQLETSQPQTANPRLRKNELIKSVLNQRGHPPPPCQNPKQTDKSDGGA